MLLSCDWQGMERNHQTNYDADAATRLRESTCLIDDDTPNAEWLAVAEALGNVLPSEEAKQLLFQSLKEANHADVEEVLLELARSANSAEETK